MHNHLMCFFQTHKYGVKLISLPYTYHDLLLPCLSTINHLFITLLLLICIHSFLLTLLQHPLLDIILNDWFNLPRESSQLQLHHRYLDISDSKLPSNKATFYFPTLNSSLYFDQKSIIFSSEIPFHFETSLCNLNGQGTTYQRINLLTNFL